MSRTQGVFSTKDRAARRGAKNIVIEVAFGPGILETSAEAHGQVQLLPGALKRSSPRMNAGAPTKEPSASPALSVVRVVPAVMTVAICKRVCFL